MLFFIGVLTPSHNFYSLISHRTIISTLFTWMILSFSIYIFVQKSRSKFKEIQTFSMCQCGEHVRYVCMVLGGNHRCMVLVAMKCIKPWKKKFNSFETWDALCYFKIVFFWITNCSYPHYDVANKSNFLCYQLWLISKIVWLLIVLTNKRIACKQFSCLLIIINWLSFLRTHGKAWESEQRTSSY